MPTMPIATFVRDYARVLDEADARNDEVVLERRAGKTTFVLAPLRRVQSDRHAVAVASHLFQRAFGRAEVRKIVVDGLADDLPWLTFLPDSEKIRFADECLAVLRGCAEIGRFTAFEDLLSSWQAAANIWSDPILAHALSSPVDTPDGSDVQWPTGPGHAEAP
ncbi:MAG: hypothetical protein WCP28_21240 [Actinomycetes bacterium]